MITNNKEKTIEDYIKYFKDDNLIEFLNIPEEELKMMSRYEIKDLLEIPDNILEELSNNEDKEIRIRVALALTDYTPREILDKLSKDKEFKVKECVIRKPNIDLDFLCKMVNDEDIEIKFLAIEKILSKMEKNKKNINKNYKNKAEEFYAMEKRIYEDKNNKCIKEYIAKTIYKLSKDKNNEVRARIAGLKFDTDLLKILSNKEIFWKIKATITGITSDLAFLYRLSRDKNIEVRKALASNESMTEEDIFKILCKDEEEEIRLQCAYNNNVYKTDAVFYLANDKSHFIRKIVFCKEDRG